jgi:hypothetical protein
VVAERRYGGLRIHLRDAAEEATPVDGLSVSRAGRYPLGESVIEVPAGVLAQGELVLRRPRTGDRIGNRKLSDILIDQKVARPDRKRLWALADAGQPNLVRWVALPSAPGARAWEWPCSGIRPRLVPARRKRASKRKPR